MSLHRKAVAQWLCVVLALGGFACTRRTLKPINPCLVSAVAAKVSVSNIDKIDMLFMVDDSQSMELEQASLREQFPRLIRALTTGDRNLDGTPDFRPVSDLHLGVVSSNMGTPGVRSNDPSCNVSDDGLLQHEGRLSSCTEETYPAFLSYRLGVDSSDATVDAFSCIASLGKDGCGFEQQLEAPLKALWPSMTASGALAPAPIGGAFLGEGATASLGHGDRENSGFLRNGQGSNRSLIAVVVVTDEEDCSSANTHHFTHTEDLKKTNDPLLALDMGQVNLRCYYSPEELFPVERYIKGFQALRPDDPGLVVFAAIVGVPVDLVAADARQKVDFTDSKARDGYYDSLLADPRMIERVNAGRDNLEPSCTRPVGATTSLAYPPRRIVQVAKGMGENGIVQSICQDDFTPALDAIIGLIATKVGGLCLPRPLLRTAKGTVDCDMIWQLPAPGPDAPANTPTECGATGYEFLLPVDPRFAAGAPGAVCKVAQLGVHGRGDERAYQPTDNDGQIYPDGWFYDDYSPRVAQDCPATARYGIGFSQNATPPSGVTVKMQCVNEVQTLPNHRTDVLSNVGQPAIGDPCEEVERNGKTLHGDEACAVALASGEQDTRMFCHQELNVCVLGCSTTADCPAAWVCDAREGTDGSAGGHLCVNPTCGDLN